MSRGRHSDEARRHAVAAQQERISTLDTSPGQLLRTSLKSSAPHVYQHRRQRPSETLPLWVWLLLLLAVTVVYFLAQG